MSSVFSLPCCKFQYCPNPESCKVSGCAYPSVEAYIDPKHILSKKEAEEQEAQLKTMASIAEIQTEEWAKGMSPEILKDMLNIINDHGAGKFKIKPPKFVEGQTVACIIKRLKSLTLAKHYTILAVETQDVVRVMNDKNLIRPYSVHHFIAVEEESAKNFLEDLSRV